MVVDYAEKQEQNGCYLKVEYKNETKSKIQMTIRIFVAMGEELWCS